MGDRLVSRLFKLKKENMFAHLYFYIYMWYNIVYVNPYR